MNDLEKLEEIFNILDKAIRDISDVGELRDYDLDNAVDKIYKQVDGLQTDVYKLMQGREWK